MCFLEKNLGSFVGVVWGNDVVIFMFLVLNRENKGVLV